MCEIERVIAIEMVKKNKNSLSGWMQLKVLFICWNVDIVKLNSLFFSKKEKWHQISFFLYLIDVFSLLNVFGTNTSKSIGMIAFILFYFIFSSINNITYRNSNWTENHGSHPPHIHSHTHSSTYSYIHKHTLQKWRTIVGN